MLLAGRRVDAGAIAKLGIIEVHGAVTLRNAT
jgi:hypothetical protein